MNNLANSYVKVASKVEAIYIPKTNVFSTAEEIFRWAEGNTFYVPKGYFHSLRPETEYDIKTGQVAADAPEFLTIWTLEGVMRANPGDYIIRGVAGEYYPIKADIFRQTYNLITENGETLPVPEMEEETPIEEPVMQPEDEVVPEDPEGDQKAEDVEIEFCADIAPHKWHKHEIGTDINNPFAVKTVLCPGIEGEEVEDLESV